MGRIRFRRTPGSNSRTKNRPKEEVFGTDIPRTSGGHSRGFPGPKLRSGQSKSWNNKRFGADIHDPKARTSTTLRGFRKLRSEKLWAEYPFPTNTELSEFFGPHRVLGREVSEFLSAYYLCAKANSPSMSQNSPSLSQISVSSLFPNRVLSRQSSARFLVVSLLLLLLQEVHRGRSDTVANANANSDAPRKFVSEL